MKATWLHSRPRSFLQVSNKPFLFVNSVAMVMPSFSASFLWVMLSSSAKFNWLMMNIIILLLLLLLLLLIWQSPGLPGWQNVNLIIVTRRPLHPSIAAGLYCLTTSPGFLPALCEKWSGFFYVHRVWLSYTQDRRLKVSSERLGNEDKAPCPRALLPGRGSNRGPPVWKSEVLIARPRKHISLISLWIMYGSPGGNQVPFTLNLFIKQLLYTPYISCRYFHDFGLGGDIRDGLILQFWGCFHYHK